MKVSLAFGLALVLAIPRTGVPQGNPLTTDVKVDYKSVQNFVLRSAEKMPEADYAFKPSPDVRTFAQQIAHIADDQYNLCAGARGETRKDAYTALEDALSTKAELVPALKQAFAYCDAAYDALTDASGAAASGSGKRSTRLSMLNWNLWHTWEHYGNIVVYLRMKGIVPPSSERAQGMKAPGTAQPLSLATPKDSVSYVMGMNIAGALRRKAVDVDPDAFAQGINDARTGSRLRLTADEAQAAIKENAPKDRVSYAYGMTFWDRMRQQSIDVDPVIFLRGVADALTGGKLLISDDQAQAIMEAMHRAQMKGGPPPPPPDASMPA